MEFAIKDKNENKALSRTELTCSVSYEKAMPSRKEIREAICAATGAAPDTVVVISAKGGFGTQSAVVIAHVYKSKEAAGVERKYLLVRDGLATKEAKAAKTKAPAKK
ncbi:30S ribosomal protein S24e [uncultured archaeon]|nr:30S ribosomal protein S24e [uncultured archaeon]